MNHKTSLILTLFLFFVKLAYTNNIQDILNNKNQFQQVESLLSYSLNYGKDTSALKKNLEPVLAYAKKQQNIPLQIECYS